MCSCRAPEDTSVLPGRIQRPHTPCRDPTILPAANDSRVNTWLSEPPDNTADAQKAINVGWRGRWHPSAKRDAGTRRRSLLFGTIGTQDSLVEFAFNAMQSPVNMVVTAIRFGNQLDEHPGRTDMQGFAVIVRRLNAGVE